MFLYWPQSLRLPFLKIIKLKTFLRPVFALSVSYKVKDELEKMFKDKFLFLNKLRVDIPGSGIFINLFVYSFDEFPKCWLKLASKITEDAIVRLEERLQKLLNSCLCLYRNQTIL